MVQKLKLLFLGMFALMAFIQPTTAWADDNNPKSGDDFSQIKSPSRQSLGFEPDSLSAYFKVTRSTANLRFSEASLQALFGIDMVSFRADNQENSIPLCRTAAGGFASNPSNHKSEAVWALGTYKCPTDNRLLYLGPGAIFRVSGLKILPPEKLIDNGQELQRCRGSASCINSVLPKFGLKPSYGLVAGGSAPPADVCDDKDQACLLRQFADTKKKLEATGWKDPAAETVSEPAPPAAAIVASTKICEPTDQKCLYDALLKTGWKAPVKTVEIPTAPRELTVQEKHGLNIAIVIAVLSVISILGLMYLKRKQGRAAQKANDDLTSDYGSLKREFDEYKEKTIVNARPDLSNVGAKDFLVRFATSLGVKLDDGVDLDSIIKAFEAKAALQLVQIRETVTNLGATPSVANGQPFAQLLLAAESLSGSRSKDLEAAKRQIDELKASHQRALSAQNERHQEAMRKQTEANEKENAELRLLIPLRDLCTELKELSRVVESTKTILSEHRAQRDAYDNSITQTTASQRFQELDELVKSERASFHEGREYSLIAVPLSQRGIRVKSLAAMIEALEQELATAESAQANALQRAELLIGIPLTALTAEAMANTALVKAQEQLSQAMYESGLVNVRKGDCETREQAVTEREEKLKQEETGLEAQIQQAVAGATASMREELDALQGKAMRSPSVPHIENGTNGHANGNGHGRNGRNGPITQPFGLHGPDSKPPTPLDLLVPALNQFLVNALMVSGGRHELTAPSLRTLAHFAQQKFTLSETLLQGIKSFREKSDPMTRARIDAHAIQRFIDPEFTDLPAFMKAFPFLFGENGNGAHSPSIDSTVPGV